MTGLRQPTCTCNFHNYVLKKEVRATPNKSLTVFKLSKICYNLKNLHDTDMRNYVLQWKECVMSIKIISFLYFGKISTLTLL